MLLDLGFRAVGAAVTPAVVPVPLPRRATTTDLSGQLQRAGIPAPGATSYAFSSHDGFGMFRLDAAFEASFDRSKLPMRPALPLDNQAHRHPACVIDLATCFGGDFLATSRTVKAEDVMRQVAYERPQCGDCAILQLVGASGAAGLSAFLPVCDAPSASTPLLPPAYSTAKRFDKVSLSLPSSCPSRRLASISRILRYTYTLGDSSSRFISMRQARLTEQVLRKMDAAASTGQEALPTFLTLSAFFIGQRPCTRCSQLPCSQMTTSSWPKRRRPPTRSSTTGSSSIGHNPPCTRGSTYRGKACCSYCAKIWLQRMMR